MTNLDRMTTKSYPLFRFFFGTEEVEWNNLIFTCYCCLGFGLCYKRQNTLVSLSNGSSSHTVGICHLLVPNGDLHLSHIPTLSLPFLDDSMTQVWVLLSNIMSVIPNIEKCSCVVWYVYRKKTLIFVVSNSNCKSDYILMLSCLICFSYLKILVKCIFHFVSNLSLKCR